MGRPARPPGTEIDARHATSPERLLVQALGQTALGEVVSVLTDDAETRAEIAATARATGNACIAAIPGDGYVRILVRRKR